MTSTWTRSFPSLSNTYRYYQSGYNSNSYQDTGTNTWQTGDQTTTSYRSGKAVESESDGSFQQTSGSHSGFMKELQSEGHGDLGRGVADNGHEFFTHKNSIVWPPVANFANPKSGYGDIRLTGARPMTGTSPTFPPMSYPSTAKINADGAKLMGMNLPTTPEVGLAQFLGELREGLPKVVGLESVLGGPTARKLGSEHLNYQFGVKPLYNDLQKLARGILDFHGRVNQMKRDSGKYVRRRSELLSDSSFVDRGLGTGQGMMLPTFYSVDGYSIFYGPGRPSNRVADSYTNEVWFSGAFTYHLAEAHSFLGKLERYEQLANAALGTRFDSSTAWQLTPWSWMVDWFADVGTFSANVNAFSSDSLVMKYGYVMHRTKCVRTITTVGHQLLPGASGPTGATTFLTSERKERHRATPYGFGLDMAAFSPRRWAILGALGLTRAPGKLKGFG